LYLLFKLGYTCHSNKQGLDTSFLEPRGQSASYGGQILTKIEAAFGGGGGIKMFPACPLLLIVLSNYDTDTCHIIRID